MKKTLIALAVLGSIAGVAQAQSSVTIYGLVDQGVRDLSNANTKTTTSTSAALNADSPTQLAVRAVNRIGVIGSEDLGGGLSAIYRLEARFFADTGTIDQTAPGQVFKAQSNVGLKGNFGTVRLGRIYNPIDDIAAAQDPFGQNGIGSMQFNNLALVRQNNAIRYDSPSMTGFGVQAIYSLKEVDSVTLPIGTVESNDGFGLSATYNNGPISVGAGWNRVTNSNDSDYWTIGGGYTFGPAKITAFYEDADIKTGAAEVNQKNALIGLAYKIGAGTINASYGQLKTEVLSVSNTDKKLAVGYTHNLSKRTSLYGNAIRTDWGNANVDSTNGAEVGVTHNF